MVSFGSPVVQENVIWRNIGSSAVSAIEKFVDKFEDATAWMRRSDLGRRLVANTEEDKKVAQRNGVSYPDTEFETSIWESLFSINNYRATYLGGGVSGDAYRVQVDGDTKYVIKEAKAKKCTDPIYGPGGIKHEYEMLEKFEPDSKFQQGIALMKTEEGNYFLISHFAQGEPAGKDGYSLNRMSQENIKATLNILDQMDNDKVFNADWNLGNIFYKGDRYFPKMLDLQWVYPMYDADKYFPFTSEEKATNMVTFEASSIAQYMHNLYEHNTRDLKSTSQKARTETRDFLKMYLKERAKHCDTSNRFERLRQAVYQNPTEDVLDAEILRLSILKNHNRQFVYVDKRNEEPRDMLIMVRYQARANFAAKMLEEFQPQGPVSDVQSEYFEEMRKLGQQWHQNTKSWSSSSISYMKRLVAGEERQTYLSGYFYFPDLFGTGVDGKTKPRRNAVPDQTSLSDVLSNETKRHYRDTEDDYRITGNIKDLEEAFINLKNAVKDGDDYEKQRAIRKISKLTNEVLI